MGLMPPVGDDVMGLVPSVGDGVMGLVSSGGDDVMGLMSSTGDDALMRKLLYIVKGSCGWCLWKEMAALIMSVEMG